jgi:predicted amidohydrolase
MRATRHAVSDALAMEADLIVLPELAASGCVFGDIEEVRSAALTRRAGIFGEWQELVAPRDAVVVGGFPE